jgi:hypothetical protein
LCSDCSLHFSYNFQQNYSNSFWPFGSSIFWKYFNFLIVSENTLLVSFYIPPAFRRIIYLAIGYDWYFRLQWLKADKDDSFNCNFDTPFAYFYCPHLRMENINKNIFYLVFKRRRLRSIWKSHIITFIELTEIYADTKDFKENISHLFWNRK